LYSILDLIFLIAIFFLSFSLLMFFLILSLIIFFHLVFVSDLILNIWLLFVLFFFLIFLWLWIFLQFLNHIWSLYLGSWVSQVNPGWIRFFFQCFFFKLIFFSILLFDVRLLGLWLCNFFFFPFSEVILGHRLVTLTRVDSSFFLCFLLIWIWFFI
jgi:hypothetical protein